MKKVFSIGVLLFSCFIGFAQYNWQALYKAPISWRCDDMYFLNPQIGWVVHAYYDYLSHNQYGQVYKTWNGGDTWTLVHDSSKTFYRSVGFIDSLDGWIGNIADSSITPDTNPLYYTADGGRTLTPVTLPSPTPKGICGISIVNDSVVYAYGRYFGPARLAKTTNRGATWTTQDLTAYATGLVDGKFFDKDTGFITGCNGNNGVILYTTDGGNTFQTKYLGSRNDSEIVWKIFFPSRDTGYASIEYVGTGYYRGDTNYKTYLVCTTDGGNTWTEKPFKDGYDEEGIGFINDSVGWIGGAFQYPNYKTTDRGNTWNIDSTFGVLTPPYQNLEITGFDINRFRKFGDTLMYASGNTVYRYSNKPFTTGINNLNPNKTLATASAYPNPFTTQTTIEYTIATTGHNIKLEVFATMGKLLFTKNLGDQIAGKHDYIFKEGIPAGAYYYTISSDEFVITKKMLRVK